MRHRTHWEAQLEQAWAERSIVWLAGVRRSGKTVLCRNLPDTEYYDCERPRDRRALEDCEAFLEGHRGRRVVLDEIHRLDKPSELLKIAADHFPETRILATGSSTLGASQKFSDTLTGRKRTVWLSPMIHQDLEDFGQPGLAHRMLRGGLPPMFLAAGLPRRDYQDWFDGYWAKDLQELFRLERREGFRKLMELLFIQSGGLFEASSFASPCGISRTTVQTYLDILEKTFLVRVLRPFHSGGSREILQAPKVYGFDTGFICHHRGLEKLSEADFGPLWEHLVLNELVAFQQGASVHYWRDKQKHEIDFVLASNPRAPMALEAKWKAEAFDPGNLRIFRKSYPEGRNYLVAQDVDRPYTRNYGETKVHFIGLQHIQGIVAGTPEP